MGKNYKRFQDRIIGKLVVECIIENTSPLLMSSGKQEHSDKDCIRWVDGNPYLPSSSLIGVVRSWYKQFFPEDQNDFFWGSSDTSASETYQSHFVIDDCLLINKSPNDKFLVRDGVRIDHALNIAEGKGKYDYELLAPGHQFRFYMEITARKSMKGDALDQLEISAKKMLSILKHELFSLGALSTTGFGKIEVKDVKMKKFDFENEDGKKWFSFLENPIWNQLIDLSKMPKIDYPYCKIDTLFSLKSALITGAYPVDESSPDKVHLQANGKNVLSGNAIKGSLRHRSSKILHTLGHTDVKKAIANIYGDVDNENNERPATKSRLIVHETIIDKGVQAMVQDRIKIDRWTGGVMGGAKFDSRPIWDMSNGEKDRFVISLILLKAEEAEITLLLQLIKDLWSGDLPIGGEKNVGRGILTGHQCTIKLPNDKVVIFKKKGNAMSIEGIEHLESINTMNLNTLKTISHV